MNEIRREGKLLGTVVRMLKEVEAEIAGMIRDERKRRHPAQRGQNHPIARRLAEIHGVGPQTAGILATEVFYRGFKAAPRGPHDHDSHNGSGEGRNRASRYQRR